jgi:hypothetical protein
MPGNRRRGKKEGVTGTCGASARGRRLSDTIGDKQGRGRNDGDIKFMVKRRIRGEVRKYGRPPNSRKTCHGRKKNKGKGGG